MGGNMKRNTIRWLPLAAFVLILAACSGGQSESSSKPEPVKYTVAMTEFAFQPAELQAKVGQEVTIELVNSGTLEHEFMVGRDVKMTNNRPDGYEHDMFANTDAEPVVMGGQESGMDMGGHGSEHTGFMVIVPDESEKATVTFTATEDMVGEWEIGCFSQDGVHYDAGMKGKLVVSP
jgi:plastocyanin